MTTAMRPNWLQFDDAQLAAWAIEVISADHPGEMLAATIAIENLNGGTADVLTSIVARLSGVTAFHQGAPRFAPAPGVMPGTDADQQVGGSWAAQARQWYQGWDGENLLAELDDGAAVLAMFEDAEPESEESRRSWAAREGF